MRPGLGEVWLWDGGVAWGGPDTIFVLQRAKWHCDAVLRGELGHPWGRFGAALTALGDVNGDRLVDVAIGAPGEQENQGAVYLFHGTSKLGISPSHSQVRPDHLSLSKSTFPQLPGQFSQKPFSEPSKIIHTSQKRFILPTTRGGAQGQHHCCPFIGGKMKAQR